jgi:RHS repeat-associated protein
LYYVYTDNQGSILALTDEAGNVKRRYAYDPWGKRRDAANWNVADNGVNLIINRGYTGHEHLDAFGIINMNGRVYDPLTAQFFSPDPYVQAPGDWLNYNRYGYCMGNPFRYTDPSGEFWLLPFISWSPNGGLSIGISFGIGLPGFGAQVSLGYGFKQGNFSATAGISAGGFNAYAGFDTKAGFIAGAGFGFGSLYSNGNFNLGSNLFSAGINYSSSGGLSASAFGINISSSGINFDPSVGASVTYYLGKTVIVSDTEDNSTVVSKDKASIATDAQVNDLLTSKEIDPSKYYDKIAGMDEQLPLNKEVDGRKRGSDGIIRSKDGKILGGTTISGLEGFGRWSKTFMSPHSSANGFVKNLTHEFVHSDMYYRWGYKNPSDYKKITEYYAYKVNSSVYSNIGIEQTLDNLINFRSYSGNYIYTLPNFPFLK